MLPHTQPLGVTLDAGLTVSGSVSVSDAFLLTISKTSDGFYRISLKKSQSKSTSVDITAALDVNLDGDGTFQKVVTAIGKEVGVLRGAQEAILSGEGAAFSARYA